MDKYSDTFFIEKYVALWAYGYQNGIGVSEGLYRAINELGFSYFDGRTVNEILDVGCGVGRTTADYAKFFKNAKVTGIDSAKLMIDMANRLHTSSETITIDMSRLGFGTMNFRDTKLSNTCFLNTELKDFSLVEQEGRFDIVTAVNFLDRTVDMKMDIMRIFHLLKQKGVFIIATPLNFFNNEYWKNYSSFESLLALMKKVGFHVDVAFDKFPYREILDIRGSFEEYSTVIMRLVK